MWHEYTKESRFPGIVGSSNRIGSQKSGRSQIHQVEKTPQYIHHYSIESWHPGVHSTSTLFCKPTLVFPPEYSSPNGLDPPVMNTPGSYDFPAVNILRSRFEYRQIHECRLKFEILSRHFYCDEEKLFYDNTRVDKSDDIVTSKYTVACTIVQTVRHSVVFLQFYTSFKENIF
jgi:hypothetical protein